MIRDRGHRMAAALATAGLALTGCATGRAATQPPEALNPIVQSAPDGAKVIVLTQAETSRIGVQTQQVRPSSTGGGEASIPFSALLYDEQGENWVFIRRPSGAYERTQVTVDRIVGSTVLLRRGPSVGTPVVTVGAPELLGAQLGVGGE